VKVADAVKHRDADTRVNGHGAASACDRALNPVTCRCTGRTEYSVVNVGDLERVEATEIDRNALIKAGLVRSSSGLIKILGEGEISKALTVTADKFSGSAKEKIEKAGGTVVLTKPVESEEAKEDSE
jgi:ribosomal protein L15